MCLGSAEMVGQLEERSCSKVGIDDQFGYKKLAGDVRPRFE